jgi:hypothetical protein
LESLPRVKVVIILLNIHIVKLFADFTVFLFFKAYLAAQQHGSTKSENLAENLDHNGILDYELSYERWTNSCRVDEEGIWSLFLPAYNEDTYTVCYC